jgi:hypothetical protein
MLRYALTELPESQVIEAPSGGRKRKLISSAAAPTSARLSPTKEHIYGKLNPRDLIQVRVKKDVFLRKRIPGQTFWIKY